MLVSEMFTSHGIVFGGNVKERENAIKEIQSGFAAIGVPAMSVDAENLVTMLANILEKVAESKGPAFAVFCPDAKKIFADELVNTKDLERILKKCLTKKVLVYFASTKLSDFPDNIIDEFVVKVDLKLEGDEDDEIIVEGKEPAKRNKKVVEEENTAKPVKSSAKASSKTTDASKKKLNKVEKTLTRTASSAVTSVSRSVSTNIVNSVLGGSTKSVNQIAKQAASTSLSTFLRNIIKESLK